MEYQEIRALIQEDFAAVNDVIRQRLESDVVLIDQVSNYIVNSGGKRLRPVLVLLAAHACRYLGREHIEAAAIIEFIHTATLLHDDVVDDSELRRGQETANNVWGNQASVLVGDFLYSRSFQMMVEIGDMSVMEVLADATNMIAEGEVLQLMNYHDPDATEASYLQIIHRKTAKLFEAGSRIAAILAKSEPEVEQAMKMYGRHLGASFQLVDDVLDYSVSADEMGKNMGDDLAEGNPTLPLIYAMQHGTEKQTQMIRDAITDGSIEQLPEVIKAVQETGAIKYTAQVAEQEAESARQALRVLEDSPYKRALLAVTHFAVSRSV
ncbi:MAG: octaprenyl diphosphate synthase [Pseudomonadota bacterium]